MNKLWTEEEDKILVAVQRAVAFLAISRYARLTGLSHGDTGRKIKTDDNEKIPFEWMIDRDPETEHRHTSHLFAVYPGSTITPLKTPDLAQAARQSLLFRRNTGEVCYGCVCMTETRVMR